MREFVLKNLYDGYCNGSFSYQQVSIFATNYALKGIISQDGVVGFNQRGGIMSETMFLYRSRKDGGCGVQPNDLTLTVTPGDGKATIGWTGKRKTVIDGQTVSEIYRVAVVRNEDHVPENENDGTTIFVSGNNTASYEDTGLTNDKTYYYNVFPYSKHSEYTEIDAYEQRLKAEGAEK